MVGAPSSGCGLAYVTGDLVDHHVRERGLVSRHRGLVPSFFRTACYVTTTFGHSAVQTDAHRVGMLRKGGRILATVADGTRGSGGRRYPVGGAILDLAPKASSAPRTKSLNRSVSTLGQGDTPTFDSPGTGNNYRVQLVYGGRQCRVLRVRRSEPVRISVWNGVMK
jgi:hypothetical protein